MSEPLILSPARMASTRLPGRPLADICGAPMSVQVWRRAMEAKSGRVAVAAAEQEIVDAVIAAGGEAAVIPMRWLAKEVTVTTSMVFTLDEMATVGDLALDGRLNLTALVDDTITLDDLGRTIDDLANQRLDAVKILVDPTAG